MNVDTVQIDVFGVREARQCAQCGRPSMEQPLLECDPTRHSMPAIDIIQDVDKRNYLMVVMRDIDRYRQAFLRWAIEMGYARQAVDNDLELVMPVGVALSSSELQKIEDEIFDHTDRWSVSNFRLEVERYANASFAHLEKQRELLLSGTSACVRALQNS